MEQLVSIAGQSVAFLFVWLLCGVGLVLSCVTFSGTWFVLAAALLTHFVSASGFPGWGTLLVMLAVCILVEVAEAFSGSVGVKKKGGSNLAGFVALVGGLVGMLLGSLIPPPLIGSLLGMLVGSFVPAYLVEYSRLKHRGKAASIAWGGVVARIVILVLKVVVTLGMILYLITGLVIH